MRVCDFTSAGAFESRGRKGIEPRVVIYGPHLEDGALEAVWMKGTLGLPFGFKENSLAIQQHADDNCLEELKKAQLMTCTQHLFVVALNNVMQP